MYYDKEKAEKAEKHFETIFQKRKIPEKIPVFTIKKNDLKEGKIWIVKLLCLTKLASSHNEAKRLILQKAVSLNGAIITNPDLEIKPEEETILKIGKRHFVRVKIAK